MKIRPAHTLTALLTLTTLLTACSGTHQLPTTPSAASSAAPATLSGRIFIDAQAPAAAKPESLSPEALSARIDGREVALTITANWLPEKSGSPEPGVLDYALQTGEVKAGNQVLEIYDRQGQLLGATLIQLQPGRSRVHDVSDWSTALLMLARHQAALEGITLQQLPPDELLNLGQAPELQNPRAYLDSLADADDNDQAPQTPNPGLDESKRLWL